jgi:4-amino-4-deoxy-L-arabinose transferase-like glycosyltransferase
MRDLNRVTSVTTPHPAASRARIRAERLALAAVALGALAVRLAWIFSVRFAPTLQDDAGRYDLLGRSLAHAAGYVNPNGNTTLFWPPGYPFVLTAVYRFTGDSVRSALVLNAALDTLTVLLVYALARRVAGVRASLAAAAIYAVLPSAVLFTNITLTETTATCLLTLALWLFLAAGERVRPWPMLAAAGLVVGFGALVRGQLLLLPLVAVPAWAVADGWRQALARGALAGVVALAVITPWTVRNYLEANAVVPIATNSGVDFYIGHSAGADGRGRIVDELVFRYPNLPPAEAEARISRDGFREGLKYAARHPADEAKLTARKVFFLWYADDEAVQWTDAHAALHVMDRSLRHALLIMSNAYYRVLLAVAALGVVLSIVQIRHVPSRARATFVLLLSTLIYWTAIHIVFFADPRFHAPVMPAMCALVAVALGRVMRQPIPSVTST